MLAGIKKLIAASCVATLSIAVISIDYLNNDSVTYSALEQTNRNELYAPSEYNVNVSIQKGYTKIYENNNFEYYYSPTKTILKILNKKTGFIWSTGADNETKSTVLANGTNITKYSSEYYNSIIDVGPNGLGADNEAYYSTINQLMYFTYLDPSVSKKTRSTANILVDSDSVVVSTGLFGHAQYGNQFMFKLTYQTYSKVNGEAILGFDFSFNVRLTFTEDGFHVQLNNDDIGGESKDYIDGIFLLPRLGQSGGKMIKGIFNDEDGDGVGDISFPSANDITSDMIMNNPNTDLDGYIFVPDGSGALIRFDDVKYYDSQKTFYYDMYGDPYRSTYTESEFQEAIYTKEPNYVSTKQISMPVWGVAYGDNQDAFVAYVTEGSEYFGLVYQGRSTTFEYATIQPRFERNRTYYFRFGSNPSTVMLDDDEVFQYDIGLDYCFLSGDGSDGYAANYVGMALKYRSYLEKNGLIKYNIDLTTGPKVDFLICDVKEGLFGYSDVNVTSCSDIVDMLTELHNDGINNINSALYGWQNGGISKAKPWTTKWNRKAGGKSGFQNVVNTASDYGYSIDFYQQYGLINAEQVSSFNAYCVKALSRDYGAYVLSDTNKPITWWEYTNADVAGNWLNKQANEISKLGDNVGIATGGISTLLVPDYGKKLTYQGASNAAYQSTKEAATKLSLSGDTPNSYLWRNYDKFTNLSVYNSQLQCETDSVPFLEIVFGGKVNMYAEYANFSFYDTTSQLKMIDYNLNPSFIVSASENEDIMYTNSRDWFSTSFNKYHGVINEICGNVLPYLQLIQGKTMINRKVVEFEDNSLGLYINTYANFNNGQAEEGSEVVLAINYFTYDVTYTYNGQTYTIPAQSAFQLA